MYIARFSRKLAGVLAFVLLLSCINPLHIWRPAIAFADSTGVILTDDVNVRKEANTDSDVVMRLKKSTKVVIKSRKGQWYYIAYDGKNGYVRDDFIVVRDDIPTSGSSGSSGGSSSSSSSSSSSGTSSTERIGIIISENVNMREEASTEGKVVMKLDKSTQVIIKSTKGQWFRVTYNGKTGYVHEEFLRVVKDDKPSSGTSATAAPNANSNASAGPKAGASLKKGDKGDAVKTLQKALISKGFLQGSADGTYGNNTELAVKNFQRQRGLTVDGVAGTKTQELLYSKETAVKQDSLTMGSKGRSVINLQDRLKELGYYTYKTTGLYGSITREAVLQFQRQNKLTADGIAGAKTVATLYSSGAKKYTKSSGSSSSSGGKTYGAHIPNQATVANVIAYAKEFLGIRYKYGGSSPSTGFDCSGFTCYVFAKFGIKLPRTSRDQLNAGVVVNKSDIMPGDLVMFGNPVHHVGIYIGGGQYIHSPQTGDVVKIQTLKTFSYARRVIGK